MADRLETKVQGGAILAHVSLFPNYYNYGAFIPPIRETIVEQSWSTQPSEGPTTAFSHMDRSLVDIPRSCYRHHHYNLVHLRGLETEIFLEMVVDTRTG